MGERLFPFFPEKEPETVALEEAQRREARTAEAWMAYDFANLSMPEDIRERARAWGMEHWAQVLWSNAFQAGYRQAVRERTPKPSLETDRRPT